MNEKDIKKITLPWRGINVKITYRQYLSDELVKIQGHQIAHVTVNAEMPLPITETGFLSMFLHDDELRKRGGAVAYVHEQLNEAAKSKEWQEHVKQKSQLKLF